MAAIECNSLTALDGAKTPIKSHPRTIVGFTPGAAGGPARGSLDGQEPRSAARSLLTEELWTYKGGPVHFSGMADAQYDEDAEAGDGSLNSDELAEVVDLEEWDEVQMCWNSSSVAPSVAEASERSSASSQPISIPATCYFKDEVQRAALVKLNRKRAWYQQQLEAERLTSKNQASKAPAAQAASQYVRPTSHHHKHNSQHASRPAHAYA